MKHFLRLLILFLLAVPLLSQADGPDEQYVGIYNLIQQGDTLNRDDHWASALAKYAEAQSALKKFQAGYPDWNAKVVNYRLNYLGSKITDLSLKVPAPGELAGTATNAPVAGSNQPPTAAPGNLQSLLNDAGRQIAELQEQTRRLQAEKLVSEAKLKEALAAQPAAVDPREFARARDQITELQKQNDLLQTSLAEAKSNAGRAPAAASETAQQALADANRNVTRLNEAVAALTMEKEALQARLKMLAAADSGAAALRPQNDALKLRIAELETANANSGQNAQALADARQKIAQLNQANASLSAEKETLQTRLNSPATPDPAVAVLREENRILKTQVTELRAGAATAETDPKLREAQSRLAQLQSDNELLRREKSALEKRVQEQASAAAPAAPPATPIATTLPPMTDSVTVDKIRQLEAQRDELQKSLDAATKDIYGRKKGRETAARIDEMTRQLAALRARIELFEARQTPYTPEELALLDKPQGTLVASARDARRKSPKELPAQAQVMLAEAKRFFAAHELEKAEAKYLEVLKLDEKNVATLADLASIQVDLNHTVEAEKNLQTALAIDPDNDYALSVMGRLKLQQHKYDEALDALNHAAQINPQGPEIQNYLGITLNEKGLRGPAETALRKAVQLDPAYGSAHANLAFSYITQKPPLVELARWHYQKALAAGNPHNPSLEKLLYPDGGMP